MLLPMKLHCAAVFVRATLVKIEVDITTGSEKSCSSWPKNNDRVTFGDA